MQTSYSVKQAASFAGLIADTYQGKDIVTKVNEDGVIYIGRLVSFDDGDLTAKHPAAAADITGKAIGVVAHSHNNQSKNDGLDPNYEIKKPFDVMKKGRIWVKSEDAVTAYNSTVNVRYVAGSGVVGGFLGAAVSMETAVLPNARWITSCGAGELAVLEVNLV